MPEKFTPEHLIALLYNETSIHNKPEIIRELEANPELSEEFSEMIETIGQLDTLALDPHPTSIALIMEHSARTQEAVHS